MLVNCCLKFTTIWSVHFATPLANQLFSKGETMQYNNFEFFSFLFGYFHPDINHFSDAFYMHNDFVILKAFAILVLCSHF